MTDVDDQTPPEVLELTVGGVSVNVPGMTLEVEPGVELQVTARAFDPEGLGSLHVVDSHGWLVGETSYQGDAECDVAATEVTLVPTLPALLPYHGVQLQAEAFSFGGSVSNSVHVVGSHPVPVIDSITPNAARPGEVERCHPLRHFASPLRQPYEVPDE